MGRGAGLTDTNNKRIEPFAAGEWIIDANSLTASRGAESRQIEPRAFKVLAHLASKPGELVTIDDLMDAYWQGAVVTPNAVTRVVAHLRKVLDDDAKQPRYIQTVSRTGYRWIAEVTEPLPATGSKRAYMVAAAIVIAIAAVLLFVRQGSEFGEPTVAVLPFENLTGNDDLDYLGDGLAEEVISTLARVPEFSVSAMSRSFSYRDPNADLAQLARELDVAFVVTGSVRYDNRHLRLTAQLIDPRSETLAWTTTVESDMVRLFEGQDAVSAGVAQALAEITGSSAAIANGSDQDQPDPEAYELYLRGRYVWHRRGVEPLQPAIDYFQEAVKIDPEFARGWSALATAYLTYPSYSPRGFQTWNLAEGIATKALELDPELAEPYAVLATFAYSRFQWSEAERLFLEGIRRDPLNATTQYWYGQFLEVAGRHADAARQLRLVIDLDPSYLPPKLTMAFMHLFFQDYNNAAAQFGEHWTKVSNKRLTWMGAFITANLREDYEFAREWIERGSMEDEQKELLRRFVAVESGAVMDGELGEEMREYFWTRPDYPFYIWMGSRLGRFDDVFALANMRLDSDRLLATRPLWVPGSELSQQPEYLQLLERIGLLDYWASIGWTGICTQPGERISCDASRNTPDKLEAILSGDQR